MSSKKSQAVKEFEKVIGHKLTPIEKPKLSQRELNKIAAMIDMLKHANED